MEYNIKLFGTHVWLSDSCVIPIDHSDAFSSIQSFIEPVWMKVEKIHLSEDRFFCNFIQFTQQTFFLPGQLSDTSHFKHVGRIGFRNLDSEVLWGGLKGKVKNHEVKHTSSINHSGLLSKNSFQRQISPTNQEIPVRKLSGQLDRTLKQLTFHTGYFSFESKVKGFSKSIQFEITNLNIRSEFEAVKNYFHNAVDKRSFSIQLEVVVKGEELISAKAFSKALESLDKSLIDPVSFKVMKDIVTSKKLVEIDKSLFTSDELYDAGSDGKMKRDSWFADDAQLLEMMLNIRTSLHFQHLRYNTTYGDGSSTGLLGNQCNFTKIRICTQTC